jgi:hypothetical protein
VKACAGSAAAGSQQDQRLPQPKLWKASRPLTGAQPVGVHWLSVSSLQLPSACMPDDRRLALGSIIVQKDPFASSEESSLASTTHSRNSGSTWRWFSETGGVMLYIMMRTQLYLDEDIWNALHIQSRQRRTPISELVRMAVRDRYGASQTNRRQAMKPIIS